MKSTQGTTYRSLQAQLSRITNRRSDLQLQATSGKRLTKPSDDPGAIGPVLHSRAQIRQTDRFLETLGVAGDKLAIQDTYLTGAVNVLSDARTDALGSINGTLSESDLSSIGDKIASLKDQLMGVVNTEVAGKNIFAGYKENTSPFVENSGIVTYEGNSNPISLEISPGEVIDVTATGCAAFLGDADNDGLLDAGGVNLFNVLADLESAIRANDVPAIENGVMELDKGINQVTAARSKLGINAQRVEASKSQLEDVKLDYKETLSRYEDADLVETLSELLKQETAFQAALEVTTRVASLSILNYL